MLNGSSSQEKNLRNALSPALIDMLRFKRPLQQRIDLQINFRRVIIHGIVQPRR